MSKQMEDARAEFVKMLADLGNFYHGPIKAKIELTNPDAHTIEATERANQLSSLMFGAGIGQWHHAFDAEDFSHSETIALRRFLFEFDAVSTTVDAATTVTFRKENDENLEEVEYEDSSEDSDEEWVCGNLECPQCYEQSPQPAA